MFDSLYWLLELDALSTLQWDFNLDIGAGKGLLLQTADFCHFLFACGVHTRQADFLEGDVFGWLDFVVEFHSAVLTGSWGVGQLDFFFFLVGVAYQFGLAFLFLVFELDFIQSWPF